MSTMNFFATNFRQFGVAFVPADVAFRRPAGRVRASRHDQERGGHLGRHRLARRPAHRHFEDIRCAP